MITSVVSLFNHPHVTWNDEAEMVLCSNSAVDDNIIDIDKTPLTDQSM